MIDKWQAQYEFWSAFGWPAYNEYSVPDDAQMPYITYQASGGVFEQQAFITASIWTRSPSWEEADRKADEIEAYIRRMGCPKIKGGRMRVYIGDTVFAQNMDDPNDDQIRRKILNVTFEFMEQL